MIFSEVYSAYYQTVAAILQKALHAPVTEEDMRQMIQKYAFSESCFSIIPALQSGKWPLLTEEGTAVLETGASCPVTLLEKRWLKSLTDDPRLRLFGVSFPELEGVQPLFTRADYRVYDRFADADPYESEDYIRRFQFLMGAIRDRQPVQVMMRNRSGREQWFRCLPVGLEYSMQDDKFRLVVQGCRYGRFNLGRLTQCRPYRGTKLLHTPRNQLRDLTIELTDERNALERCMIHFSSFEKKAERLDERHYRLHLRYYEQDETELVIRVLSFGPYLRVTEPESFVDLIRQRLISQKSCGPK